MGSEDFKVIRGKGLKLAIKSWDPLYRDLMLKEGITHLVLSGYFGWRSPDIAFLRDIPFLQRLDLMVLRVRDVSPLYDLPALRHFSVAGDMSAIDFTRMISLRSLGLNWSPKKFSSLVECTQLESLGIEYVRTPDLAIFGKLRNLSVLGIGFSDIANLNGVQSMSRLTRLSMARVNKLTSFEHLDCCRDLKEIRVEGARLLRDVTALASLTELTNVTFSECPKLESISALRKASKIETIGLMITSSVKDGDLRFILDFASLRHATIRDRKHYNITNAELPKLYRTADDALPRSH